MQSTEGWRDGESAILLQGERNAFGKKHRRASLQSDYSLTSLQCLFYSPCNFTYFWKVKQLYWSMTSIQEKISVINVNFKKIMNKNWLSEHAVTYQKLERCGGVGQHQRATGDSEPGSLFCGCGQRRHLEERERNSPSKRYWDTGKTTPVPQTDPVN